MNKLILTTVGLIALLSSLFSTEPSNKWEHVLKIRNYENAYIFSGRAISTDSNYAVICTSIDYFRNANTGEDKPNSMVFYSTQNGFDWEKHFEFEMLRANGHETQGFHFFGKDSFYITQDNGSVRTTYDQGKTYNFAYPWYHGKAVKDIYMIDHENGYIFDAGFYKTSDAWDNIDTLSYSAKAIDKPYSIFNTHHLNILPNGNMYAIISVVREEPVIEFIKYDATNNTYEIINTDDEQLIVPTQFYSINDSIHLAIGNTISHSGGSQNDVIIRTTDGGKTWNIVLDVYSKSYNNDTIKTFSRYQSPFGIQEIGFKDNLSGIAVGQFGKIIYTYDGGRTWVYENNPPEILKFGHVSPAIMRVKYFKDQAMIFTSNSDVLFMTEDNIAPKLADTFEISGYVNIKDSTAGAPVVAVALDNRICMTDSTGFYQFTRVSGGYHRLRAINKYYDGTQYPDWVRRPYLFEPEFIGLDLSSDTIIDITAIPNDLSSISENTANHSFIQDIVIGSDAITFTLSDYITLSDLTVSIFTTEGRIVRSEEISNTNGQVMINVDGLSIGRYWLVVEAEGKTPYIKGINLQ